MSPFVRNPVGVLAMLLALPAAAGEWQLTPASRISTGYASNPRFRNSDAEAVGESVQSGDASLLVAGGTETMSWLLTPRVTFARYRSDRELDTFNQYFDASSSWQGERWRWALGAQAARDSTQESELTTTGLIDGNTRRELIALNVGPRWFISEALSAGAAIQWSGVDYLEAESGLVDYSRRGATAHLTRYLSSRTSMTLSAQTGQLEVPETGRTTRDSGATLGIVWQAAENWTASFSAGPSWAELQGRHDTGYLLSTAVSRRGERTTVAGSIGRQLNALGTGSLSEADTVSLNTAYELSERISIGLRAGLTRNRELLAVQGVPALETRYREVAASLGWQLARDWKLSLDAENRTQDLDHGFALPGAASDLRVSLGLAWGGRTRLL